MKKYAFEFDSIEKAQKTYCSGFTNCGECPFRPFALSPFKEDCTEYAAQHPDKAIELMGLKIIYENENKEPKLTEQELAICKAVGAKWVERQGEPFDYQVHLWSEKPDKSMNTEETSRIRIGGIRTELFPSVCPGDLVNVEEILKEAEA